MFEAFSTRSSILVALVLAASSHAQMHKVEKPERVTRALGVYEWTGDIAKPSAARLIPVSLFMEGHFEDAGVYLARPVPFTLQTGDVYSIEEAGLSLGTLDVDYARNIITKHSGSDDEAVGAWYGYGKFAPPYVPKKSDLHAAAKPAMVDGVAASSDDDDQPHLAVRAGAQETGDVPATKGDSKTATTNASPTPNPAPADDPDRPTLRHRDPVDQTKRNKKEKPSGEVIPMGTSLNEDPDRPRLRRGVPTEELVPQQLSGLPPNLHQAAAVSDAVNRDAHIFTREWETPNEHQQTLLAVQALGRPLVAAYLAANKLQAVVSAPPSAGPSFASKPVAKPTATTTTRRPGAKKAVHVAPTFSLTNEVLTGYLLSYGGLPTFVYTVEVPVAAGGPVYLTMLTQRLPSGELQVALKSVTDATHMNRVPWMRPVDVVDPDDSHRASILMELRAQSSRQFALYRVVTAQAEQTFATGIIE